MNCNLQCKTVRILWKRLMNSYKNAFIAVVGVKLCKTWAKAGEVETQSCPDNHVLTFPATWIPVQACMSSWDHRLDLVPFPRHGVHGSVPICKKIIVPEPMGYSWWLPTSCEVIFGIRTLPCISYKWRNVYSNLPILSVIKIFAFMFMHTIVHPKTLYSACTIMGGMWQVTPWGTKAVRTFWKSTVGSFSMLKLDVE